MSQSQGFSELFAKACRGDELALRALLEQYGEYLRRVIRQRLDERLRSRFDSLDFVQMVWASFFADAKPLERFASADEMIRYLVAMVRNKVLEEQRRRAAAKRGGSVQERPLDETAADTPRTADTPSKHAIARERLQILEKVASQRDREIVQLRMMGLSYREIADRFSLNERSVRKIIHRLTHEGS